MSVVEFIGDEVSAAGYRLCGVDVHVVDHGDAMSLIREVRERASLVLLGSSIVRQIPVDELDALLGNADPPVLVVPDVRGLHEVPDIVSRVHKQLGMLE